MSKLTTNKVAPISIVLPHYAFGAVSFFVLTVLMFISSDSFTGHYFSPRLLAITHIATLAWGSMLIFGALYQFLPVVLVSDLYSPLLARITFICFVTGISLLIYSFWNFSVGVPMQIASCILLSGATFFIFNIIATSRKAKENMVEAEFIVTSGLWFWLTVLIGTLLAFNFTYAFFPKEHLYYLKIHAHIGIAGWFLLLIIGVSSKLIPMFLLSSSTNKGKLKYAYYIINGALFGFLIDSFLFGGVSRGLIYFILVTIGVLFYFSFLLTVYRKRAKKVLDIGMKQSMIAFIIVCLPLITGILINTTNTLNSELSLRVTIIYGISILLGFISLLILGQTFKTLPFIVWLKLNKSASGQDKPPLPKNLYSEPIVRLQFIFFSVGLVILIVGVGFSIIYIIQIACVFLMLAALLYNINVFKLLLYRNKNLKKIELWKYMM
jgi:hypothetical protein